MPLLRACARLSCVAMLVWCCLWLVAPSPVGAATSIFEVTVYTSDGSPVPPDARACLDTGSPPLLCSPFNHQDDRVYADFMPLESEWLILTITASGYEPFSQTYSGDRYAYQVVAT